MDITQLKGIGTKTAANLNRLSVYTIEDLVRLYPRDYIVYEEPVFVNSIGTCDKPVVAVEGTVVASPRIYGSERKSILSVVIKDENSETIKCIWYNSLFLKSKLRIGMHYVFRGRIAVKRDEYVIEQPDIYTIASYNEIKNHMSPVYPLTKGLSNNIVIKAVRQAVEQYQAGLEPEYIPDSIMDEYNLSGHNTAIHNIHFPESMEDYIEARHRIAFEELLTMQLLLLSLKNKYKNIEEGIKFDSNVKMSDVINDLPFKLTKAQMRVLEEIDTDMESNKAMNRLLQGDVGSGKTIVAIIAAYKAVKSGYQMAMMAPTSILATQHLENFKNTLEKYNITCELLLGNTSKKKKEDILNRLKDGKIDIIIGTHSLLEENVVFKNLGLVVTDEQHRFGVRQRSTIVSKGKNPDVLVMTATPIPRTLALILYGDLDISIIDELPPNRKKIDTFAVRKSLEERINNFIKKQIDEGRQAYIVCPLVEESEEIEAKSVMELAEKYKNEIFKDYKVEYLHGKMKSKEKDEIMQKFKDGQIDILISTTVIEVGVDVPNSNIMVIENAERFGLAQLHQLRGRVGRGEYKSYCILKYQGNSELIRKRMQVMQDTNDGFVISEKDLELRGSGEFFGTKQHGIPEFKVANLFEDLKLLKLVQSLAIKILEEDSQLEKEKNLRLKKVVEKKLENRIEI